MCCCSGTKTKETSQMVKDVVCGMQIDPKRSGGQERVSGPDVLLLRPRMQAQVRRQPPAVREVRGPGR